MKLVSRAQKISTVVDVIGLIRIAFVSRAQKISTVVDRHEQRSV